MMATRPGPLQDIPLHHERLRIRGDGELQGISKVLSKRPSSPSSHSLCSPPKRRLVQLDDLSGINGGTSTPNHSRLQTILSSANSPARKLDFGAISHSSEGGHGDQNMDSSCEPLCRSLSDDSTLLPSLYDHGHNPTFTRSSSTRFLRRVTAAQVVDASTDVEMRDPSHLRPLTAPSSTAYEAVPREVQPPNVSSEHYPGFSVYQDPSDYVYHVAASTALSMPMGHASEESDKENAHPFLSSKTYLGQMAWTKAGLDCPKDVEMASPGKSSPDVKDIVNFSIPSAQRSIRDIGNIRERALDSRARAHLALTSGAFLLLGPEERELAKLRWKKRAQGGMEVENDNGYRSEA